MLNEGQESRLPTPQAADLSAELSADGSAVPKGDVQADLPPRNVSPGAGDVGLSTEATAPCAGDHEAAADSGLTQLAQYQQLAPAWVTLERRIGYVTSAVVWPIILLVGAGLGWDNRGQTWVWLALLLAALVLTGLMFFYSHTWPDWRYQRTRWRLTAEGMEIERGVFWRHRLAIPVARVQHIDVSQGPLERAFQLGTLTIHTAGTKDASIQLSGLEHSQAMLVRDILIRQKEASDVI